MCWNMILLGLAFILATPSNSQHRQQPQHQQQQVSMMVNITQEDRLNIELANRVGVTHLAVSYPEAINCTLKKIRTSKTIIKCDNITIPECKTVHKVKLNNVTEDCSRQREYCQYNFRTQELTKQNIICERDLKQICTGSCTAASCQTYCERNPIVVCSTEHQMVVVTEKRQRCGETKELVTTKICFTYPDASWTCRELRPTHDCEKESVRVVSNELGVPKINCIEKEQDPVCLPGNCRLASNDTHCLTTDIPVQVALEDFLCEECSHGRTKLRPVLVQVENCDKEVTREFCVEAEEHKDEWTKTCTVPKTMQPKVLRNVLLNQPKDEHNEITDRHKDQSRRKVKQSKLVRLNLPENLRDINDNQVEDRAKDKTKISDQLNKEKNSKPQNIKKNIEHQNTDKNSEQQSNEKNIKEQNREKNIEQKRKEKISEQPTKVKISEQQNKEINKEQQKREKDSEKNREKNHEKNKEIHIGQQKKEKNIEEQSREKISEQQNRVRHPFVSTLNLPRRLIQERKQQVDVGQNVNAGDSNQYQQNSPQKNNHQEPSSRRMLIRNKCGSKRGFSLLGLVNCLKQNKQLPVSRISTFSERSPRPSLTSSISSGSSQQYPSSSSGDSHGSARGSQGSSSSEKGFQGSSNFAKGSQHSLSFSRGSQRSSSSVRGSQGSLISERGFQGSSSSSGGSQDSSSARDIKGVSSSKASQKHLPSSLRNSQEQFSSSSQNSQPRTIGLQSQSNPVDLKSDSPVRSQVRPRNILPGISHILSNSEPSSDKKVKIKAGANQKNNENTDVDGLLVSAMPNINSQIFVVEPTGSEGKVTPGITTPPYSTDTPSSTLSPIAPTRKRTFMNLRSRNVFGVPILSSKSGLIPDARERDQERIKPVAGMETNNQLKLKSRGNILKRKRILPSNGLRRKSSSKESATRVGGSSSLESHQTKVDVFQRNLNMRSKILHRVQHNKVEKSVKKQETLNNKPKKDGVSNKEPIKDDVSNKERIKNSETNKQIKLTSNISPTKDIINEAEIKTNSIDVNTNLKILRPKLLQRKKGQRPKLQEGASPANQRKLATMKLNCRFPFKCYGEIETNISTISENAQSNQRKELDKQSNQRIKIDNSKNYERNLGEKLHSKPTGLKLNQSQIHNESFVYSSTKNPQINLNRTIMTVNRTQSKKIADVTAKVSEETDNINKQAEQEMDSVSSIKDRLSSLLNQKPTMDKNGSNNDGKQKPHSQSPTIKQDEDFSTSPSTTEGLKSATDQDIHIVESPLNFEHLESRKEEHKIELSENGDSIEEIKLASREEIEKLKVASREQKVPNNNRKMLNASENIVDRITKVIEPDKTTINAGKNTTILSGEKKSVKCNDCDCIENIKEKITCKVIKCFKNSRLCFS